MGKWLRSWKGILMGDGGWQTPEIAGHVLLSLVALLVFAFVLFGNVIPMLLTWLTKMIAGPTNY